MPPLVGFSLPACSLLLLSLHPRAHITSRMTMPVSTASSSTPSAAITGIERGRREEEEGGGEGDEELRLWLPGGGEEESLLPEGAAVLSLLLTEFAGEGFAGGGCVDVRGEAGWGEWEEVGRGGVTGLPARGGKAQRRAIRTS